MPTPSLVRVKNHLQVLDTHWGCEREGLGSWRRCDIAE